MSEAGKFLNTHQFTGSRSGSYVCPTCRAQPRDGHAETCELAAILTAEGFSPRYAHPTAGVTRQDVP